MKRIGNIDILKPFRTVFGALRTTNVQEEAFVSGKVFSYEDYKIFADGEIANYIFDPTAFTGTNLVVTPPSFSANAGPITVEYFIGAIANSDGTLLGVSNRRGTSTNENQAILRLNPTGLSDGTRFSGRLIPATGLDPKTASGVVSGSSLPFELNCAVKYLIRITNTDGEGVYVQTDFTWMEI
jgi:hypothetical protein